MTDKPNTEGKKKITDKLKNTGEDIGRSLGKGRAWIWANMTKEDKETLTGRT